MAVLLSLVGAYALLVITWIFYLAVMNLSKHRDQLHPIAKANAYLIVLPIALLFDAALNLLVCFLFLRVPHDWLLTGSLKRFISTEDGWREKVAAWICEHLLNQFDPDGSHC